MSERAFSQDARGSAAGGCRRGMVFTLTGDLGVATKITKSAQACHLDVKHLDRCERLLDALRTLPGNAVVVVDWDTREADGYKVLKAVRETADFRRASVVGFVSSAKQVLKKEAEICGCLRVYGKTEFFSGLEMIWLRYVR